jgi:hypothetical protein
MQPIYVFFLVIIGVAVTMLIVSIQTKSEAQDRRAQYWANVATPLFYRTQDIDDDQVLVRAANARAMLKEHGNVYLLPTDVRVFVWGSDNKNQSLDFDIWAAQVDIQIVKIREQYAASKAQHAAAVAAHILSGQKIPDFNDIKDN